MSGWIVDPALCNGHGQCEAAAPAVFTLDAEGYLQDTSDGPVPIAPENLALAQLGQRSCPEQAIQIVD